MNPSPVFQAYSRYYDLLYQDKDYLGEVNYIKAMLTRYGVGKGDLLEFGSGTGKHGCLLAKLGYTVHGIERSAEMVLRADSAVGFTCQQDDICEVKLGRTFDAVLSLFHVVSYQTSNANLMAVFARAAEHLCTGGLFIFDFWYSPAVYSQRPAVRVKRMADKKLEITRLAEPVMKSNDNQVEVNYTIFVREKDSNYVQTIAEVHHIRHLSLPEIDLLASAQGFERVGTEEFLSGKVAGQETWAVCVTLKKI